VTPEEPRDLPAVKEFDDLGLTQRQQLAIHLYIQGDLSTEEIAEQAGYSNSNTLGVFLRSERGQKAVLAGAKSSYATLVSRALKTQERLLEAKSELVREKAAEAILSRAERLGMMGDASKGQAQQAGSARPVQVSINLGQGVDSAKVIDHEDD